MLDNDLNLLDSDELMGDECLIPNEAVSRGTKGLARRRYEMLMEEKRLQQQLDEEIGYW